LHQADLVRLKQTVGKGIMGIFQISVFHFTAVITGWILW